MMTSEGLDEEFEFPFQNEPAPEIQSGVVSESKTDERCTNNETESGREEVSLTENPFKKSRSERKKIRFVCFCCERDVECQRHASVSIAFRFMCALANGSYTRGLSKGVDSCLCNACFLIPRDSKSKKPTMEQMCQLLVISSPAIERDEGRHRIENLVEKLRCLRSLFESTAVLMPHVFSALLSNLPSSCGWSHAPCQVGGLVHVLVFPGDSRSGAAIFDGVDDDGRVQLRDPVGRSQYSLPVNRIYVPDPALERATSAEPRIQEAKLKRVTDSADTLRQELSATIERHRQEQNELQEKLRRSEESRRSTAREYDRNIAELHVKADTSYQRGQAGFFELREEYDARALEIDALNEQLSSKESTIEKLRTEMQICRKELATCETARARISIEAETAYSRGQHNVLELQGQVTNLNTQLQDSEDSLRHSRNDSSQLRNTIAALRNENSLLRATKDRAYAAGMEGYLQLQQQLDQERSNTYERTRDIETLNASLHERIDQVNKLKAELKTAASALTLSNVRESTAYQRGMQGFLEVQQQLHSMREEVSRTRQALEEFQRALTSAKTDADTQRKGRQRAEARVRHLENPISPGLGSYSTRASVDAHKVEEGKCDAEKRRNFLQAIHRRFASAQVRTQLTYLDYDDDSDIDLDAASKTDCIETLARHETTETALSYLDGTADSIAIPYLRAVLIEVATMIGPHGIMCAVESMFPHSFWCIAGEALKFQLQQFMAHMNSGDIAANTEWTELWMHHFPAALVLFLFGATAGDSELRGNLGCQRNKNLLNQSVSIGLQLCYMINPHFNRSLQVPLAIMCMMGQRTKLSRTLTNLGVAVSDYALQKHHLDISEDGQDLVLALIRLAVMLGMCLILIFDNIDWNRRADVAIHMMNYMCWFGDLTSKKLEEDIGARRDLSELVLEDIRTESHRELSSAEIQEKSRNDFAEIYFSDSGHMGRVLSLLSSGQVSLSHHNDRIRNREKRLGRPCMAPIAGIPDAHESDRMRRARTSVAHELQMLEKDSEPRSTQILVSYSPHCNTSDMRGTKALSVVEGEHVLLVQRFEHRDLKVAYIKKEKSDEPGVIPLFCITGNILEDSPPEDRLPWLTTPSKDQRSRRTSRADVLDVISRKSSSRLSSSTSHTYVSSLSSNYDVSEGDSDDIDEASKDGVNLNRDARPYDNDRKFQKLCSELVSQFGGASPKHPASCVPLLLHNGKASSQDDCKDGEKKCLILIEKALAGLDVTPIIIKFSDYQETKATQDDQDKRREIEVRRVHSLDSSLTRTEAGTEQYQYISKLKEQSIIRLHAIDQERVHANGNFHATMCAIRGYCNTHGDLCFRGLIEAAGYAFAIEKICACANGYYKLAISLIQCANAAWGVEAMGLYHLVLKEGTGAIQLSANEILKLLRQNSLVFTVYDRALRREPAVILDLHTASELRADNAHHLVRSAQKRSIGLYAMGGNHNMVTGAARDIRNFLIANQSERLALAANSTVPLREKRSQFFPDQAQENFGVREFKDFVGDPHTSTVEQNFELFKGVNGVVDNFMASMGVDVSLSSDSREHRDVLDESEVIARMQAAIRRLVIPSVIKDFGSLKEPSSLTMPLIPLSTDAQGRLELNEDYIIHYDVIMKQRVECICNHSLRDSIGGIVSFGGRTPKPVHYPAISVLKKTRVASERRLRSQNSRLMITVGVMMKNKAGDGHLEFPHCALSQSWHLRHNAKSRARLGLNEIFFSSYGEKSCMNWTCGGRTLAVDGRTFLTNTIVRMDTRLPEIIIHLRVWDGNMAIRRVQKRPQCPNSSTGVGVILSFFNQFCGADFEKGIGESIIQIDAGGCLIKMMEEAARDDKVLHGNATRVRQASGSSFDVGVLGPGFDFHSVFGDRSTGGGRQQIQRVAGIVCREPNERTTENASIMSILERSSVGDAIFGIGGVGGSSEERGHILFLRKGEGIIHVEDFGFSHQLEDGGMIYTAFAKAVRLGKNAEIVVADIDLVFGSMVAIARFTKEIRATFGILFIRNNPGQVVEGEAGNYVNCNEAVDAIESHADLQHIPEGLRVFNVAAICVSLGSDATHSWFGISQNKGLEIVVKHMSYIGCLVRLASPDEATKGLGLVVDQDAYERMTMVIFGNRESPAIADNWRALSVAERGRILDGFTYAGVEKLIAQHRVPDVTMFMLSQENLRFACGRCELVMNSRFFAIDAARPNFFLRGLEVVMRGPEEGNANVVLSEPLESTVDRSMVLKVRPKFTLDHHGRPLNTPFSVLFGTGGPSAAMITRRIEKERSRVRTSTGKRCGRCRCPVHAGSSCVTCAVDPCIEKCKRCMHPPHDAICTACDADLKESKSRAKCLERCPQCLHLGSCAEHLKNGCKSCGDGDKCNALASICQSQEGVTPKQDEEPHPVCIECDSDSDDEEAHADALLDVVKGAEGGDAEGVIIAVADAADDDAAIALIAEELEGVGDVGSDSAGVYLGSNKEGNDLVAALGESRQQESADGPGKKDDGGVEDIDEESADGPGKKDDGGVEDIDVTMRECLGQSAEVPAQSQNTQFEEEEADKVAINEAESVEVSTQSSDQRRRSRRERSRDAEFPGQFDEGENSDRSHESI